MAPKRNLQPFSSEAKDAKRKGKKALIENTEEKKILKQDDLIVDQTDSSTESIIEDEEGLDIWERESRRMFPPREETNAWRTWTTQESAILEMEYMASMLDVVPITGELDDAELGPEVQFDMQYFEEEEIVAPQQAAEQQEQNLQGIEDKESAKIPQVDPVDAPVDAASVNATVDTATTATEDVLAATADASDTVADPSSFPPINN